MNKTDSLSIRCEDCFHSCLIPEGQTGLCQARQNKEGRNVSLNYGVITSIALDPIEKKPLNRFYPGSHILSVGSFGCNLFCPFCQNHSISRMTYKDAKSCHTLSPSELCDIAEELREKGNIGVAFTYNEPLIGWEFVADTSKICRDRNLKTVLVTNGTISRSIAADLLPLTDALNIDLKGFTEDWYRRIGGSLSQVKDFISMAVQTEHTHVELTTLIIPGENDSIREITEICEWIAGLDPDIPLHISRFFPAYKMTDRAPSDYGQMQTLIHTAKGILPHVYAGNL